MSKGKKYLIQTFLGIAILIIVAIPVLYLFGLSYGWKYAVRTAESYGVILTKKDLSLGWRGGLRFVLTVDDLRVEFAPGGPLQGFVNIPRIDADVWYHRSIPRIDVAEFEVVGINGSVGIALSPTSDKAPSGKASIPDLYGIQVDVPSGPIDVRLGKLNIESAQMSVTLQQGQNPMRLNWDALRLNGRGEYLRDSLQAEIAAHLVNGKVVRDGLVVEGLSSDIHVTGRTSAKTGSSLAARFVGESEVRWESMRLSTTGTNAIHMTARDGQVHAQISEKGPTMKAEIAKISGVPGFKSDLALKADLHPEMLSPTEMKIHFNVNSQGLLDGSGELEAPRAVDEIADQIRGKLKLTAQSALIGIFVDDWPRELSGPMTLDLFADRRGEVIRNLRAKVSSRWLNAEISGRGNPADQTGDASGSVAVQFPNSGVRFFGNRFAGSAAIPFKALFRGSSRIFLEGTPKLQRFSFRSDGVHIQDVSGQILVSQSWAVTNKGWSITPILEWNPFNRVDLESTEALDSDQNILTVQKIVFQGKELGPLRLSASFRQNLLFVPSWSLQCPTGRFQGVLLSDLQLERPRVGIGINAIAVDMSQVLPETMLQGHRIQADPTSFSFSMDWDLMKAQAAGSFDWIQMTPGQVYNALDILDPLSEKPAFNTARGVLNRAYPTRVLMTLRGAVADISISTNLIQVPTVTNVAISPYLVKFREDLYKTSFVQGLQSQR